VAAITAQSPRPGIPYPGAAGDDLPLPPQGARPGFSSPLSHSGGEAQYFR